MAASLGCSLIIKQIVLEGIFDNAEARFFLFFSRINQVIFSSWPSADDEPVVCD